MNLEALPRFPCNTDKTPITVRGFKDAWRAKSTAGWWRLHVRGAVHEDTVVCSRAAGCADVQVHFKGGGTDVGCGRGQCVAFARGAACAPCNGNGDCAPGYYCGAVGWIDTERQRADLAVAIRTFTVVDGHTTFGTGAGITVGSDPAAEWVETELKAARLLAAATGSVPARAGVPS